LEIKPKTFGSQKAVLGSEENFYKDSKQMSEVQLAASAGSKHISSITPLEVLAIHSDEVVINEETINATKEEKPLTSLLLPIQNHPIEIKEISKSSSTVTDDFSEGSSYGIEKFAD
jgi:hypothetical protein